MALSGTITQVGYQVLHTAVIGSGGMGFVVTPPPLPANPCYGVFMLVIDQANPAYRFVATHKTVWRDGVVLFPPYPDISYDLVFVARPASIGRDFFIQI
jgi:hypothetical protein